MCVWSVAGLVYSSVEVCVCVVCSRAGILQHREVCVCVWAVAGLVYTSVKRGVCVCVWAVAGLVYTSVKRGVCLVCNRAGMCTGCNYVGKPWTGLLCVVEAVRAL